MMNPSDGCPHWSKTSEWTTYRLPKLDTISRNSIPHFTRVCSAQSLHQSCAGNQNFPARAVVAGEGFAAESYEIVLGHRFQIKPVFACGLIPYTSGEVNVLVLFLVEEHRAPSEKEIFLHAHPHVDYRGLFLVGERPSYFLASYLGECTLFDLHFEYLTIIRGFAWHGGKLSCLHVELACGAPHADEPGLGCEVGY